MSVEDKIYLSIVKHYEECLEKYGDNHLGVDWPKMEDVDKRYKVMIEVIPDIHKNEINKLLDFGCGASHLYEYIVQHCFQERIIYSGLDLSRKFIDLSQKKYPDLDFYCLDVLEDRDSLPDFDYIVMNGVFTEKRELTFDEMFEYFKRVIHYVFKKATKGIAFNVMSKHVDWERDDLFHLPLDTLASFLTAEISRNFVVRNDYGLYEYTTYVYKNR